MSKSLIKGKSLIKVRDLTTRFGSKVIHSGLDLEVLEGEVLGVIGPSGEGKSVLLRAITSLMPLSGGEVEILGERLKPNDQSQRVRLGRQMGILFQDGALFSTLSVRENVMAPMREHLNLSVAFMREVADFKLAMAGFPLDSASKRPSELSGGMRKRAALARALALDPPLLFLDEPTAGLDPIGAEKFDALIAELQSTLDLTVFLVTHDLDSLYAICDRVAVLRQGDVRAIGPIEDVSKTDDAWIRAYFSGPRGRAVLQTIEAD